MKTDRNRLSFLKQLLRAVPALVWVVAAAVVFFGIVVGVALSRTDLKATVGITKNQKIDITPMQIASIERIGQWEFLSVADEELVDTVRYGFFGDDRLVRIYYGTLRLGIDLSEAGEGWITARGDSVVAMLPPVRLLDDDFIDEGRTRAFIETGKWTEADRAALLEKARRLMREQCLTPSNMASAERNASLQMERLLRSMGFQNIRIIVSHKK